MSFKTATPHGFSLCPADAELLRGRPPAQALAWAASAFEPPARVIGCRPLPGGTSSAVHALAVAAAERAHEVVLRRYVRTDWLAEEPDLAEREAEVLHLLEHSAVPAPRLVAVDPSGAEVGVPAVLMTSLRGEIRWARSGLDAWLPGLAEALPAIHAVSVPPDATVRPYRPYELGKPMAPPSWTGHRHAWERAIELYNGPPPVREQLFIHRDYHPGNVLWSRGLVSGIVDWANASLGSPEADVGHCRGNLIGHLGPADICDTADRFLAHYIRASGRDCYHPYWDIATVPFGPEDSYGDPDPVLDEWIASLVAELG